MYSFITEQFLMSDPSHIRVSQIFLQLLHVLLAFSQFNWIISALSEQNTGKMTASIAVHNCICTNIMCSIHIHEKNDHRVSLFLKRVSDNQGDN